MWNLQSECRNMKYWPALLQVTIETACNWRKTCYWLAENCWLCKIFLQLTIETEFNGKKLQSVCRKMKMLQLKSRFFCSLLQFLPPQKCNFSACFLAIVICTYIKSSLCGLGLFNKKTLSFLDLADLPNARNKVEKSKKGRKQRKFGRQPREL